MSEKPKQYNLEAFKSAYFRIYGIIPENIITGEIEDGKAGTLWKAAIDSVARPTPDVAELKSKLSAAENTIAQTRLQLSAAKRRIEVLEAAKSDVVGDVVERDWATVAANVAEAYGLLWGCNSDNQNVHEARKFLLACLSKNGQQIGIAQCNHRGKNQFDEVDLSAMCNTRSEPQGKALPSKDEAGILDPWQKMASRLISTLTAIAKDTEYGSGNRNRERAKAALAAIPQPAQEITTPLNGGTTQYAGASAPTEYHQTSRDGLGDSCERGDAQPKPGTQEELAEIIKNRKYVSYEEFANALIAAGAVKVEG